MMNNAFRAGNLHKISILLNWQYGAQQKSQVVTGLGFRRHKRYGINGCVHHHWLKCFSGIFIRTKTHEGLDC